GCCGSGKRSDQLQIEMRAGQLAGAIADGGRQATVGGSIGKGDVLGALFELVTTVSVTPPSKHPHARWQRPLHNLRDLETHTPSIGPQYSIVVGVAARQDKQRHPEHPPSPNKAVRPTRGPAD